MKRKIIMLVSIILFIISICGVFLERHKSFESSQKYESLKEQVSEAAEKEEINSQEPILDNQNDSEEDFIEPEPKMLGKYADLYAQNNDLVGWLDNGDLINYPIMKNVSDSDFYLHRDFDKAGSKAGSLYIPNDIDIDDSIVLVYGHHQKDLSMFGSLKYYLDENYLRDHSMIRFSNLYEEKELQVLGVFVSKVYPDDYTGFEYYNYRGNVTDKQFNEFITGIEPLMQTGDLSNVSYGDKIIELSTCWYSEDNARLVLICKQS